MFQLTKHEFLLEVRLLQGSPEPLVVGRVPPDEGEQEVHVGLPQAAVPVEVEQGPARYHHLH